MRVGSSFRARAVGVLLQRRSSLHTRLERRRRRVHAFQEKVGCASASRTPSSVPAVATLAARRPPRPAFSPSSVAAVATLAPRCRNPPGPGVFRRERARRRWRVHASRVAHGVRESVFATGTRAAVDGRIGARGSLPPTPGAATENAQLDPFSPELTASSALPLDLAVALRKGSRARRRRGRQHDMGAARAVGSARARVDVRHRLARLERPSVQRPRFPRLARGSTRSRRCIAAGGGTRVQAQRQLGHVAVGVDPGGRPGRCGLFRRRGGEAAARVARSRIALEPSGVDGRHGRGCGPAAQGCGVGVVRASGGEDGTDRCAPRAGRAPEDHRRRVANLRAASDRAPNSQLELPTRSTTADCAGGGRRLDGRRVDVASRGRAARRRVAPGALRGGDGPKVRRGRGGSAGTKGGERISKTLAARYAVKTSRRDGPRDAPRRGTRRRRERAAPAKRLPSSQATVCRRLGRRHLARALVDRVFDVRAQRRIGSRGGGAKRGGPRARTRGVRVGALASGVRHSEAPASQRRS